MSTSYHFALLGQGIGYSKSPDLFKAIARELKTTITFDLRSIEPADLDVHVAQLQGDAYDGFALTIPFKKQILPHLAVISDEARAIGSVNCVKISGDRLEGHNTDAAGFMAPLMMELDRIRNARILVIGTGGAALASIYALVRATSPKHLCVLGRQIESHREELTGVAGSTELELVDWSKAGTLSEQFELIVNCTPLGGWNQPGKLPIPPQTPIGPTTVYYDLNYNRPNRAVEFARMHGCFAIDGSSMLIAQGIKAFEIWTGKTVPFDAVYQAVFEKKEHA
jgi:shikimate dehydrogenase